MQGWQRDATCPSSSCAFRPSVAYNPFSLRSSLPLAFGMHAILLDLPGDMLGDVLVLALLLARHTNPSFKGCASSFFHNPTAWFSMTLSSKFLGAWPHILGALR